MEKTILGLSINTRMTSLAIISGDQILNYDIKFRPEAWTPIKKELILANLHSWFERYNITSIALIVPYENQISSQSKELLESLKKHLNKNNISLCVYSPKTLHAFYQEPKTKKEIMQELASEYTELVYYYKKEMQNKNKYYIKLFDAVQVGIIHSQRMK